jgi:hypothetical protein
MNVDHEERMRDLRHAIARRLGLWPIYGRASLLFYAWAVHSISPKNPDAHKVGKRYALLRAEFEPLSLKTR